MRSKIGFKLILAVGCGTILIVAVYSYIIVNSQYNELLFQVKQITHQLSETVKSSTKYDMLMDHRQHLHRMIDAISDQESIEKVRIFNKEGEIIYSSDKNEMNTMVDKQAEACYACHTADEPLEKLPISERTRIFETEGGFRNLGIINPIYNEPSCWKGACHEHVKDQKVLGVLDITVPLKDIDAQLRSNEIKLILLALSMVVLISVLLWALVRRFVAEPVRRLAKATDMIAKGDLHHEIEVNSNDELGNLAKSFNQMTLRLADAQKQIYRQDRLASLGHLAAGIAHELNNPLTGILSYSSYMLKRADGDDQNKKQLEVIVRETKRCRDIVKSLLDFARENPSKKCKASLNEIVSRTLEILDNQFTLDKVTVKKTIRDDLPQIQADSGKIQQVLINIIVNALDAMRGRDNAVLSIETGQEEHQGKMGVVIKIADTGCGMSPDQLRRIYDPFYSTKGLKGTGLGLSVVWGIIDDHNGRISVETKVGQGTKFIVYLPIDNTKTSSPLIKE